MKINLGLWIIVLMTFSTCKKTSPAETVTPEREEPLAPVVDPPLVNSIGFFLDDWSPKTFSPPESMAAAMAEGSVNATVTVDAADVITKIPPAIFGHNANSWMTQIVTEPGLMNHLENLRPSVIRFPGGSISDLYFWNRSTGQKPGDAPDSLLDAAGNQVPAGYWYGRNNDTWTISVDNYYNLLQQTGSQGIIIINYAYARYGTGNNPVAQAAHLAADWVRYDNGRTKYWEIGNESNGTWEAGHRINTAANMDGQPAIITGALYGQHIRVFIDSMKKAAQEIGKVIYISANLLEKQPELWQNATDQTWNTGVLSASNNAADFYSIHSYYTPFQTNAKASEILNSASVITSAMSNYVEQSLRNSAASIKPIALTEWNITSQGSMQQVSHINGMHATIVLGEAIKNKYGLTSRWDLANGWANGNDHGLFNIGDEPGGISKWNPRPAFYYMYYFQQTIGDRLLKTSVTGDLLAYASSFSSGAKGLVLVNKSTTALTTAITIKNASKGKNVYWYTLSGGTDNSEFSRKVFINGTGPSEASGGPAAEYKNIKAFSASVDKEIKILVPQRSVIYLVID